MSFDTTDQAQEIRRWPCNAIKRVDVPAGTLSAARAVARKIGYQFPTTPEGKLMRGIFDMAVGDLFIKPQRVSACRHLQGRIMEAELCGIDSEWIRLQFKRAGVSLEVNLR